MSEEQAAGGEAKTEGKPGAGAAARAERINRTSSRQTGYSPRGAATWETTSWRSRAA